jgi:hypothetical protein
VIRGLFFSPEGGGIKTLVSSVTTLRGFVMISFSFPGFAALTLGFIPPPSGLNLVFFRVLRAKTGFELSC